MQTVFQIHNRNISTVRIEVKTPSIGNSKLHAMIIKIM